MELNEIVQKMKDKDFVGYCTPGCGSLLGLRLLVQHLEKFVLVNSPGCVSGSKPLNVPYVNIGFDAAAAASALARADLPVVAYAGDGATGMHISSIIDACSRNDRLIYVCYNNFAYSEMDYPLPEKAHVKSVVPYAAYAATASVAYAEDFLEKLNKAASMDGVRFIELLAPCPSVGGFDASNTVEVARLATESGLWPLYEVENRKINITKRPLRLEPVSGYFAAAKREVKDMQKIQETINKNWRTLSEGKLL